MQPCLFVEVDDTASHHQFVTAAQLLLLSMSSPPIPPVPDVNEGSVVHTLQLLHPKLDAQLQLAKKVALIGPLTELVAHEHDSGAGFLTPEYRAILQQAPQLRQQSSRQPAHLERLYGTMCIGRDRVS